MIRISFILALLLAGTALAADDSSKDYFDHGAENYTHDDIEKARSWVDEGLQLYPGDHSLTALKQLLEQQQQQQQQQKDKNQQSGQQGQEQKQQQDQSQNQDQQKDEQQEKAQQQPSPSQSEVGDESKTNDQQMAMSPEEAERMLDAMREKEAAERARIVEDQIRQESQKLPMVEKDW
ncbi:MAG: hypothetical protein M9963_10895 [Kiritimatiellae bacterium]|nr:hypothetical protein [Kiritimatiellia bacterium]MCO5062479.1 hypothetical protein [Kiritimatiellia bacterium]MCO6401486.1 hypothetical protein [Verrucomicrobiota bacterium]